MTEILFLKKVEIVPLEVIVRNKAAGSLSKRLGLPEGTPMKTPVLEFCYKDDALGDPMVNEYHILAAGFATKEEIDIISKYALKINEIMIDFFKECKVDLNRTLRLSSADIRVRFFLLMRFHLIHAVSGIWILRKNLIKTVSVVIWAVLKRLMPR